MQERGQRHLTGPTQGVRTGVVTMQWLEIKVETGGEMAEAVSGFLHRFCSSGVAVEPTVLPDDDAEGAYHEVPSGTMTVRAYLPIDSTVATTRGAIEQGLWHLRQLLPEYPAAVTYTELEEDDWAHAWKAHYHALPVGTFLIVPAWETAVPEEGQRVLRLDPGMAFGTGVHASTQLILRATERVVSPGAWVADIGTGSGILSIASVLLGATHVEAVDLDPNAVEATTRNAQLNGVESRIVVRAGSVEAIPERGYDVILANIIAPVIAALMPALVGLMRGSGVLLVAGIILDREHLVHDAIALQPLHVAARFTQDDWVCLELRRA